VLGFTLSKINLLILVTATFAIVAYFMFGLMDVVISEAAQQTIDAYAEKAANVVTSESLCFKTQATIPRHISYFGGLQASKRFFYVMHISRYPETHNEDHLSSLIFAISDRKDQEKIRAASKIDVNAEIIFYDWNPTTINIIDNSVSTITLDPQSISPQKDSFMVIKEVVAGKNYLHIIACSSDGMCPANCDLSSEILKNSRGSNELSLCLNPQTCAQKWERLRLN
jgi:hypothetical protein